jgi:hypothetical protein
LLLLAAAAFTFEPLVDSWPPPLPVENKPELMSGLVFWREEDVGIVNRVPNGCVVGPAEPDATGRRVVGVAARRFGSVGEVPTAWTSRWRAREAAVGAAKRELASEAAWVEEEGVPGRWSEEVEVVRSSCMRTGKDAFRVRRVWACEPG